MHSQNAHIKPKLTADNDSFTEEQKVTNAAETTADLVPPPRLMIFRTFSSLVPVMPAT